MEHYDWNEISRLFRESDEYFDRPEEQSRQQPSQQQQQQNDLLRQFDWDEIERLLIESDPDFENQVGSGQQENVQEFFEIGEEFRQYVKSYKGETRALKYKLKDVAKSKDSFGILEAIINDAIEKGFEMGKENSLVGLEIAHPNQNSEYGPILIPFSDREKLTAGKVINTINSVIQSNEIFRIDNNLSVQVTAIPQEMRRRKK